MSMPPKGFSHPLMPVLLVIVIAVVGFAGWMVFSGDSAGKITGQKQASGNTDMPAEQKPRLKNLGLGAIGPYDAQAGKSGDLLITGQALNEYDTLGLKGFYIFGDKLGKNDKRKNPNFEFASLPANTPIIASIDGVVVNINRQADSNDYEVFLQPTEGSAWTIAYDHLIDVAVLKGDTATVGKRLGSAAVQSNGLARFELQVDYGQGGQTVHYCPSAMLDDITKTKEIVLPQITALQTAWEGFSGKDLYNQSAQKVPGCLSETLTPAQAAGR